MKAARSASMADTISADVLLMASRTATRASEGSTSACTTSVKVSMKSGLGFRI